MKVFKGIIVQEIDVKISIQLIGPLAQVSVDSKTWANMTVKMQAAALIPTQANAMTHHQNHVIHIQILANVKSNLRKEKLVVLVSANQIVLK